MKTVTFIISTFSIGLFLFSCNSTTTEQSTNNTEVTAPEEHHEHAQHNESGSLQLNNGEKWIVNDEMKPFVSQGEALLEAYIANNDSDYKALANQIKEQNSQLIKSCTMDGRSHDELHVWLHPHLELVDALSETDSKEEADGIITQLTNSYNEYKQFFN